MKIVADENLFEPIIDYLRELGHDVFSIRSTSHSGISDDEIYTLACEEKRVIMTMDKILSKYPGKRCERESCYYNPRRCTHTKNKGMIVF
jgi:uncharacterized protein with PIN domain